MNLCTVVPGGIVVFFPSYDYEKRVHTHWEESGVLDRIGKKKKVPYYYVGQQKIRNCPGIIGTDLYSTREMSGIIRTGMQLHAR